MFTSNILQLLHLSDPALPIGSFSHSAGLETYTQLGVVNDKLTAKAFIEQQLSHNIFYNDAAIASLAFDAAGLQDYHEIEALDALCTATKLPAETRSASQKLGTRLLKIFAQQEPASPAYWYQKSIAQQQCYGHYAVAFGLVAQTLAISKADMLTGFYYNAAAAFTTNAVKLVPLGQADGQTLLKEMFPLINSLSAATLQAEKEMVGYCCPAFDIRCMQHEDLYTRLYMS